MTVTEKAEATPIEEFVARLEGLAQPGAQRGDLARLRRCAGRPLDDCPEVYQLFYRLLPYLARGDERVEESYFLIATLFALDPHSARDRDLGASLRAVATARGAGAAGIDRRLTVLLDAPVGDLAFRLRQVVALCAAAEVAIDWRGLLSDLRRWEAPDRRVQRRWARSYFGRPAPVENSAATTNESED